MSSSLRRLGAASEGVLADAGRLARLAGGAGERLFVGPLRGERPRWRETLAQVGRAGDESLFLVALITFLMGMILALQSAYQLRQLGTVELVAQLVAVSVVRELAPLLTAVLVAGRAGSAIAAELGTMKVSEEIDALRVMGLDPVSFLVVPRLLGLTVAAPCLTLFADLAGITGGSVIGSLLLGIGTAGYWSDSIAALHLEDLWSGTLKALMFGVVIALVSCQQGLETHGGSSEVGRATTRAVVRSIVLIIVVDLFFTAWLFVRG